MKVLLQRNLFLGETRYRQSNDGTEIPEYVQIRNEKEPRKVVLFKDYKGSEKELALPKDAVLYDDKVDSHSINLMGKIHRTTAKQKPMALSEMPKAPSNEELLEKKK